jgi:hypothetical protein
VKLKRQTVKLTRSNNKLEHENAEAISAAPVSKKRRGQSLVELAMLLPVLVLLLSVVIEAGLMLNAWVRVNTASRDATRFLLDQGRQGDITNLVLFKLKGVDFGASRELTNTPNVDIYKIVGATTISGTIPNATANWKADHIYGPSFSGPKITRSQIETRLRALGNPNSISFVIIEVDFRYTPVLASLITPGTQMPMSNYAIIQKEPNN